jgi:hypothetical protein
MAQNMPDKDDDEIPTPENVKRLDPKIWGRKDDDPDLSSVKRLSWQEAAGAQNMPDKDEDIPNLVARKYLTFLRDVAGTNIAEHLKHVKQFRETPGASQTSCSGSRLMHGRAAKEG